MRHGAKRITFVLSSVVLLGACATGGTLGGDPNVLTQEQIASIEASDLYEVVQRLRPLWLRSRARRFDGTNPVVVYRDNVRLGSVAQLRDLSPDLAEWLSYLDASTASASLPGLGSTLVEGAIVVHTSPRGR